MSLTAPAPPRYRPMRGTARSVCVKGSVEGVKTAAAIVAPTTTKRHWSSICFEDTRPVCPSNTWMTGTCNARPSNLKSSTHLKLLVLRLLLPRGWNIVQEGDLFHGAFVHSFCLRGAEQIARSEGYLECQSSAKHKHQDELKVLINGPQGLYSSFSI